MIKHNGKLLISKLREMKRYDWKKDAQPSPGSKEAVKKGCTCAVMDNAYGQGARGTQDLPEEEKQFWVTMGCPLHNPAEREKE